MSPADAPPPAAAPGQGLARDERIRRRAEFLRCYREGRRRGGRLATLFYAAGPTSHPRLGVTASRKVGGAVVRQRLKRRVREIFRRWERRAELPPLDLVFNLKPAAAEASFGELASELERQLGGVLAQTDGRAARPGARPRRRSGGAGRS